jgi:glycosyltransferase involved in cell wall biosynthesis
MTTNIAVVIPCYRVKDQILGVLDSIDPMVSQVVVVDDACPDNTAAWVLEHCHDPRLKVITHTSNQGVGGAMITGYQVAIENGADILVKIDGDGQMDPSLIERFVRPILNGQADYTKGNRFYDLRHLGRMPLIRLIGNAVLSFMAKLSTGYWNVFDITNGYTAIHAKAAKHLDFEKISRRYFFETDMLFRLNLIRAVVVDIPMDARYGDESSNLKIRHIAGEFLVKHIKNLLKRIFYNYFLRDMSAASLELVLGLSMLTFGIVFGSFQWMTSVQSGISAPLGTIMLAALPTLLGIQFLLAFVSFDVANTPRRPVHLDLN